MRFGTAYVVQIRRILFLALMSTARLALVVVCLLLSGRPAAAEWFADVYAGPSLAGHHDLKLDDRGVGRSTFRDVEFGTALSWGGRFGRYFDSLPFLGLAVDFFRFSPNIDPQSVRVEGCLSLGSCGGGQVGTGSVGITGTGPSIDPMLWASPIQTAHASHGRPPPTLSNRP